MKTCSSETCSKRGKLAFYIGTVTFVLFLFFSLFLLYNLSGQKYSGNILKIGNSTSEKEGKNRSSKLIEKLHKSLSSNRFSCEKIVIDIKHKHFEKIKKKRLEALKKGILIQEEDDFVPATIRTGKKNIKIKMRLKGDWVDHIRMEKKWSFRIHVKKGKYLFGLRRFSIQHPKTRNYQGELLFFENLKHEGVLTPRYFFSEVIINGETQGIMAIEEQFSKELLEFRNKRESVIVKFDESLLWESRLSTEKDATAPFTSYSNTSIDCFQSSRVKKSPNLYRDYRSAVGLIRGFLEGTLSPSDVFDPQSTGTFLAVCELWGAWHPTFWHNLRFYYNPVTAKLEIIAYDGNTQNRINNIGNSEKLVVNSGIALCLLEDDKIFSIFHKKLDHLIKEVKRGELIEKLKQEEAKHLPLLKKEFPLVKPFPFVDIERRAKFLEQLSKKDFRETENPGVLSCEPDIPSTPYVSIIHAYLTGTGDTCYLELGSAVPHEVNINSIKIISKKNNIALSLNIDNKPILPLTLKGTLHKQYPEFKRIKVGLWSELEKRDIIIEAEIPKSGQKGTYKAKPYFSAIKKPLLPISTLEKQLSSHPFLSYSEKEKELKVIPGNWEVDELLIIPPGFHLTITSGTTLVFRKGAGIISHGPVSIKGTQKNTVTLKGYANEFWSGIAVLESEKESYIENTIIMNTEGFKVSSWHLDSGVTFYKSNAKITDCSFKSNICEDFLNIISSVFSISDTTFSDTLSDAFDSDFSSGTITNCTFSTIGTAGDGDAVDFSGSKVHISKCRFDNIGDKALSAGEKSIITAIYMDIHNVGSGIVCKDGSYIKVSNSSISSAKIGAILAYIKKPQYRYPKIDAQNIIFNSTEKPVICQIGSSVTLDGKKVLESELDVGKLYSTKISNGNIK